MSRLALENTASLLDDDREAEMWEYTGTFLEKNAGIYRYEISNYAQPGFECRHNVSFWSGHTYLGFGPAAVSFTGDTRRKNPEDFSLWLEGSGIEETAIEPVTRARELFALRMRMPDGMTETAFESMCGLELTQVFGKEIENLMRDKLLIYDGERVFPTQKGLLFADQVAASLI
jgi:oxygen-independent coproporphyrinogen-3 oxidase